MRPEADLNFLMNLRVSKKLLLLAVLALCATAFPSTLYTRYLVENLHKSQREAASVPVVKALLQVVKLTQIHRGLSAGVLSGNQAMRAAQEGKRGEADKEIKNLITASVERVELGTALADRAGVTMGEVVSAIQRVTDIMASINVAGAEQTQGIAQVSEAVSLMDQATQQNAALVEQSAAAALSLNAQAERLVAAVSAFRLVSN
jgi:uncharacterized phage infection (PIP) family protein YhgE